jgi:hypothetical protein
MNRRATGLYLILVLALMVSACGGDAAGGSGGGDAVLGLGDRGLDRCSLISETEAEAWLGGTVTAAPSEGFDGESDPVTCFYEADDSNKSILVQVYDGEVFFAEEGSAARSGETIEGLGDDAWKGQGKVSFLQSDWTASVSLISGLIPDEDILEMAELMSSRLP